MRRTSYFIAAALIAMGLVACNKEATTSADSTQPRNAPDSTAAVAEKANPEPAPVTKAEPPESVDKIKPEAKVAIPAPARKITIPAGTKLHVALLDSVSSDKSQNGDQFMASLTEPVVIGGKTVLAKGTKVRGRVVEANESGRVKGRASLVLTLSEIVRDGKPVSISTHSYTAVAESTKKRDAGIIGGAAGVGAAIGAVAGGGKGAAIGAAAGGGAGTGTVLATKGKDVRYGPEQKLTFSLSNPIEI
jgi:hypothetical protein